MFNEARVLLQRARLKLIDASGQVERVMELTCVIEPFTAELAHEIGEDVAEHLFDDADELRDELKTVTLHPTFGLQRLQAKIATDMAFEIAIGDVTILSLTAARQEDPKGKVPDWLRFAFVLQVPLGGPGVREWLVNRFGALLYLHFEAMQAGLPLGEQSTLPTNERAARSNGGGDPRDPRHERKERTH